MNEFWVQILIWGKKELILGQKRINFGVVKITSKLNRYFKYFKALTQGNRIQNA